ncbi:hypothetical protein ACET3Z_001238 [Daucus carota]
MVFNSQQLSLKTRPTFNAPNTITDLLGDVCNKSDQIDKLNDIVQRLQDEIITIDAFKTELPLTVLFVNDGWCFLLLCKKSNNKTVLKEFIPLKKGCYEVETDKESGDKKNWMSSVQLWNHSETHNSKFNSKEKNLVEINKDSVQESVAAIENLYKPYRSGIERRGFVPFKGYPTFPMLAKKEDLEESLIPRLSLLIPGINTPSKGLVSSVMCSKSSTSIAVSFFSPKAQSISTTSLEPLKQQTGRKRRRCWSQDLHIRFVTALQQLGGSQVRYWIRQNQVKVDIVKSHLQKYRLHTRKVPAGTTPTPANGPASTLGGLWSCKDQYSESAKQNMSQSGSPQGPLQLTETTGGTSTVKTDSMDDDEDDKSQSYCYKTWIQTVRSYKLTI